MKYVFCLIVFLFPCFAFAGIPDDLQSISVTIKSGDAQGSGVIVTRKQGKDTYSFIWTAGHVVDGLRSVREAIVNGSTKTIVYYKDAEIVQEIQQSGRRVGEVKYDAKVIKVSESKYGEDIALLMVYRKNAYPVSVSTKFILKSDYVPSIGSPVVHVGSLLGQFGANSFTSGLIAQTGRTIETESGLKRVFDQTTVTAFPGSSGGGVFLEADGAYIGMLVRGAGQGGSFNFIVPIRRMHKWAKDNNIEWAINPTVKMPSIEKIEKIQVE
jgi:S1-C subfamily serine protease